MSWRSSSSRRKCPQTTLDPGLPSHLTILPRSAFFRVCTSTGSALFVLLCIVSVYLESVPSSVTEVDALIGCLDICCCRDVFHVDQGVRETTKYYPADAESRDSFHHRSHLIDEKSYTYIAHSPYGVVYGRRWQPSTEDFVTVDSVHDGTEILILEEIPQGEKDRS